jgi:hypothetical protein
MGSRSAKVLKYATKTPYTTSLNERNIMTNNKTLLSYAIIATTFINAWATVAVTGKAQTYISNAKNTRPAIYEIRSKTFSPAEIKAHLDVMAAKGFSWDVTETVHGKIMYRNKAKAQYLIHDFNNSSCSFWNREIPPLDSKTPVDTPMIQAKADAFLLEFLGPDAANFRLVNKEYLFGSTATASAEKRVEYLVFRYVRVLDGRLVLDNTCHARITVGDKGVISRFDIRTPELIRAKDLNKELKAGTINAYLTKKINSDKYSRMPDGKTIAWKNINVVDGTASYFSEIRGSKRYLVPGSTFYAINQFPDDKIIGSTIHVSMDAENIPEVKDDEIIDYLKDQGVK